MDKFVVKPHLHADYTTESVKAHDDNQPPGAKRQRLSESNDLESIANHWKDRKLIGLLCSILCYFQCFFSFMYSVVKLHTLYALSYLSCNDILGGELD